MPFPVEEKYIIETENELGVKFPIGIRNRMMVTNGGEVDLEDFNFELHPFFDKSDKKRISRTCNHIGIETKNAKSWEGFPQTAIAIGNGGSGDIIFLQHNGNGELKEEVYLWNHGEIEKLADSILELDDY